MENATKLAKGVLEHLVCPICKDRLSLVDESFLCANKCGVRFPIVDGVPILINDRSSVFSIDDFLAQRRTTFDINESKAKKIAKSLVPSIGRNIKGAENNKKFVEILLQESPTPRVLVIGAGTSGGFTGLPSFELTVTDVCFAPRVAIVCDAHDIPFPDGYFDGAIAHAVLEHVADPHRCVDEIHRVLRNNGVVYADTPFMAQVHGRQYDFERFTYLGHRRLFRRFEEVASGASIGPGTALAWAYCYFLLSFATRKWLRRMIWAFGSVTSFYLKYVDLFLIDKPGTLDAASAYYFIGRKSESTISDRALATMYRGGF